MGEWVSAKEGFVKADVVRWKEAVFIRRPGRKKLIRVGERSVSAEVISDADAKGFVRLLVRAASVTKDESAYGVPLPKIEEEIRRAVKTLMRGKVERLRWSDESARSLIASKFLGKKNFDQTDD